MPVTLYKEKNGESLGILCNDEWEMPIQIDALEAWLFENEGKLEFGNYIADLGFRPRKDPSGGGAILSSKAMKIMVGIGMELYLSEYPVCEDD